MRGSRVGLGGGIGCRWNRPRMASLATNSHLVRAHNYSPNSHALLDWCGTPHAASGCPMSHALIVNDFSAMNGHFAKQTVVAK